MKKCLALLALICAVSFATPVSEHGKLSVSGRKILDKDGKEYVLRGMSMYWNRTDWPGGKFYKQSSVTEIAGSNWNANLVRAAIGDGNLTDAKNFMDWTAAAGIYVIMDWHYHNLDENGAKNFFREVAGYAKTKNYNHVLYEVYNEPTTQTWQQIKTYSENVIDVIRQSDPDGLIIVGTPSNSADISKPKDSPITGNRAKNVLYTFHFYSSDPSHATYMTTVKSAWCAELPIFVTEFGTSKADGGKDKAPMDKSRTDNWMSLIESMGLSWANWSLSDADESSAALRGNCCGGGTFSNSNLSESGSYIQNIMKKRNTGGTIASAGLTQQTIDCSNSSGGGAQERDGIIRFGTQNSATNYQSISGMADSVNMNTAWILRNSAGTFSASYNLTDVPGPGSYKIEFRYGTAATNATVSWQGTGFETGTAELTATGAIETWKSYTFLLNATSAGSTPLTLNFNTNAASNFAFVNLAVGYLSKNDSVKFGIDTSATPIAMQQSPKLRLLDVSGRNLLLHSNGDLEIYSLQGKRQALFQAKASGEIVSLQNLPAGAYVAVLRKSGQVHTKMIYLK